jgi:hypothetical protein
MDYGLFGEDGAASSKKNMKMFGYIVGALAAGAMVGTALTGYQASNPGIAEMPALPKNRLGSPSAAILRDPAFSSPMAKLAITAININERMNRGERDISAKALQELGDGWSRVDEDTKRQLTPAIEGMKYKKQFMAGITEPMGYFDPLACSTGLSTGKLLFYREVELKHGRLAMLAALGFLVGENFHPLFGGNIDTPAIYAFQETPLQTFWAAVVASIAIPEIYSVFTFQEPQKGDGFAVKGEQWTMKEDHEPGNLGFDPLGLKPTDQDELVTMQTKELNNGRLAMIAVAGMVAQELVTGQKLFP